MSNEDLRFGLPRTPQPMPSERPTTLYLNDEELLTIQATPIALEDWTVGFLYTEGLIGSLKDLLELQVDEATWTVRAQVNPERLGERHLGEQRYLTSGCGKGITFSSVKDALMSQPITHDLTVSRKQLLDWIRLMQRQAPYYSESGGMHSAATVRVSTGEMLVREDIGRHNAVDKALGAALRADWPQNDLVLLTSGRISYEMCAKLARTGVAVGASLTAATDQAIRLADKLGIDLIGYTRNLSKMLLYTQGRHIQEE